MEEVLVVMDHIQTLLHKLLVVVEQLILEEEVAVDRVIVQALQEEQVVQEVQV